MTRKIGSAAAPRFTKNYSKADAGELGEVGSGKLSVPADGHFLPLGQQCETMIGLALVAINKMPRAHKPVIGRQIESAMWQLLELITRAGRRFHKSTTLEDAVIALDMLRAKVRAAHQQNLISHGMYRQWALQNDLIGRDLGAWHRREKEKAAGKLKTATSEQAVAV